MTNQAQCPNCGGYKIDSHKSRIDPETGKPIVASTSGCGGVVAIFLLLFLVMFAMSGGVLVLASRGEMFAIIMGLIMFLLGLLPSISIGINLDKIQKAEKRAYNLYMYNCNLCGYHWDLREGQPWPKVKVNSDLIAKGAQKLEEEAKEAEEERKRQEALYHLSKLGKK